MGNSSKRDAKALEHAEKWKIAVEARKAGNSLDECARLAGLSHRSVAFRAIQAAIRERIADLNESVDELVSVQMAQLDDMTLGLYADACKGEPTAVKLMLEIQKRRAALKGLDAPTKQHNTGDLSTLGLAAVFAALEQKPKPPPSEPDPEPA